MHFWNYYFRSLPKLPVLKNIVDSRLRSDREEDVIHMNYMHWNNYVTSTTICTALFHLHVMQISPPWWTATRELSLLRDTLRCLHSEHFESFSLVGNEAYVRSNRAVYLLVYFIWFLSLEHHSELNFSVLSHLLQRSLES